MFLVDGQRVIMPEAFGESVNTFGGRRQYIAPGGLGLAKSYATYGQLYRAQLWIGAVVRKRANALARLPLRFPGEDGRLTSLFGATPGMNPFTLVRWIQATEDIYGEAMLLKVRVNGVVVALLPMHPTKTQVVVTVEGGEQHVEYWFQGHLGGAPLFKFAPSEVIHFKEYNPDELWRGMSVLESLRETLANEDASRRATRSFWEQGARPGVVVEHPMQLSDDGIQRLRASVDAAHAGADNFGATLVLEEGATARIIQLSSEEMQYIEARKLNREEVCAAFDLPPPVMHILDHATFSNITENLRSMYRDTMTPPIQLIEATLLDQLVKPDFSDLFDAGVMPTIDMSGVLRGDWETRVTAVASAVQNSLLTPAEGRKILDLDVIDDPNADELYANAALTRLDSPGRMTAGAGQPASSPSSPSSAPIPATIAPPAPKALPPAPASKSLRSIMGRLGSIKADKSQLRAALVAEHAKVLATHLGALPTVFDPNIHPAVALAVDLLPLSQATVKTFGDLTAVTLGTTFDHAATLEVQAVMVANAAAKIIAAQRARIDAFEGADDEELVDPLSDDAVTATATRVADTQVTSTSSYANHAAATQAGAGSKTWITAGSNPRESHAALNGETVPIGDLFSNGLRWPGDSESDDADELAGCTFDVSFDLGGQ